MKRFTLWTVKKILSLPDVTERRKKIGYVEGYLSIFINLILTVVKGITGLITGSLSIFADAVHSFSDVLTSVVVIIGFKISSKPADAEHPFGHGRVEAIATLIIAIVLFSVGIEFFISGIKRVISPIPMQSSWTAVIVVAITVIIKELLAQYSKHLAHVIDSKAIEADFWHHRSDTLSSLFVIAGVVGTLYGIPWLDGAAAIAVSLFLLWVAFSLSKGTVNSLIGEPPSKELLEKIKLIALAHPMITGVHDIIVHHYGQRCLIGLHIEMDDNFTAMQVHDAAEEVEDAIEKSIPLSEVTIHCDPLNKSHKDYEKIKNFLDKEVEANDALVSYHDLRIVGSEKHSKIIFDLSFTKKISEKEMKSMRKEMMLKIWNAFKTPARIKIEEKFKYQV